MKKMFSFSVIVSILAMGTLMVNANSSIPKSTSSDEITLALASSSSYRVTCYRIERKSFGWSTVTKHGTYDEGENTLTVDGETFKVRSNPSYGEDSAPGRYQYKAGPYYLNL